MGKRGPRPQPTMLKELRSTIRTKDRRRGPDAVAPAGGLVPPHYFTAAMRDRWDQVLADAPRNVLRPIDAAVLADFIVNEALAEQALCECGGQLVIDGDKARVQNPYLRVFFKATEAKRAAMRELGFTPSARVGLPIDNGSADDDPENDRWRRLDAMSKRNALQ